MSKPFDPSLLSGYLDGELDADEISLVERVLEEQPERLRELDGLRHLQRSLNTLPTPQPTVDPVAAVRARIEQNQPAGIGSPRRWWLQVTPFALAACLLLAVGWVIFGTELKPAQLVSQRIASPSIESARERTENADRFLSENDSSGLSQLRDQPVPDFQPRRSLSESREPAVGPKKGEADFEQPQLAPDATPEQLSMAPSEPTSRSRGSRADLGARLLDAAPEREEASPGGMGGGFGRGAAPAMSEADDGLAKPRYGPPEPADAAYSFRPEAEAPPLAMSLDATTVTPRQLNRQRAVRLRYEVPEEAHAETVRWLRTVVPRELKELTPSGEVKRYWFLGYQQEQEDLQAAIKKRLEVTGGELKVVQSASEPIPAEDEAISAEAETDEPAAGGRSRAKTTESQSEKLAEMKRSVGEVLRASPQRASDAERSRRVTARPDGSLDPNRLSDAEGQPTAIIIEMFAQPKE